MFVQKLGPSPLLPLRISYTTGCVGIAYNNDTTN